MLSPLDSIAVGRLATVHYSGYAIFIYLAYNLVLKWDEIEHLFVGRQLTILFTFNAQLAANVSMRIYTEYHHLF